MLKKLTTIALTAAIATSALLLVGCSSQSGTQDRPYGLTGTSERKQYTNQHVDSKGHYRPDWR